MTDLVIEIPPPLPPAPGSATRANLPFWLLEEKSWITRIQLPSDHHISIIR